MSDSKNLKLVPATMHLDRETIGAINFHCGDGGDNFGEHSHGLLWVGALTDDEGVEVYGLHLATAEYPEEGSTTLVEFAPPEDSAQSELTALREELAMSRDDLIIFKSAVSALGEVSKKLVFCARTTGGTAGPDQGLMDACSGVESVITLGGIARAMNEFEQLTAERDELTARLEQARDRKNSIVDLQQRLTAAEQRNAVFEGVLRDIVSGNASSLTVIKSLAASALKPTESGASE